MLFADGENPIPIFEMLQKVAISGSITIVSSLAAFLIGRYRGRYKALQEWKSKAFLNRVIVSLNIFEAGFLKIRTVLERSIQDVFLNSIAIEKVELAAKACTLNDPLIRLPKADRWFVLNFVLNNVAEHFAAGQIKLDAGVPVTKVRYALFLTCEVLGEERIRKIRAMLVREDHMKSFPYPDTLPRFESPLHEERIKTLRKAAEAYAAEPDLFLMMELCV